MQMQKRLMIDFPVGKIATFSLIEKFMVQTSRATCVGIATQLAEGVGVVTLSGTHLKVAYSSPKEDALHGQSSIAFQTHQVL